MQWQASTLHIGILVDGHNGRLVQKVAHWWCGSPAVLFRIHHTPVSQMQKLRLGAGAVWSNIAKPIIISSSIFLECSLSALLTSVLCTAISLLTMFAFRVLEPALVHTKVMLQITPIHQTNTCYRQLIGGSCNICLRFIVGRCYVKTPIVFQEKRHGNTKLSSQPLSLWHSPSGKGEPTGQRSCAYKIN